jgi:single-stranded DNA-binding protein
LPPPERPPGVGAARPAEGSDHFQHRTPKGRDTRTTTFLDATVWRDQAENVALSLHKGDRVIVTGRVETRVYTPSKGANAGQEVRKLEVLVDEIGPSPRWAEAQIQRTSGQRSEEAVPEEAPL